MENGKSYLTVTRKLISFFKSKERHVTPEEIAARWRGVEIRAQKEKRTRTHRNIFLRVVLPSAAAAGIACALWLGGGINGLRKESIMNFAELSQTGEEDSGAITLLMADGRRMEMEDTDAVIRYSADGSVAVNSGTLSGIQEKPGRFNRLVIPKGKKANLILPDGTDIWANSATRVIWPAEFKKNSREIFVEGEAYLDVTRNENAPFTVRTAGFDIKVLGTSFNVSAYPSDPTASVVLVNGKVNIKGLDQKEVGMKPGQLVNIKEGSPKKPVNVDVSTHVCWVDDILIYEDERLDEVFRKLGLRYDKNFILDPEVGRMLVSGKLDLSHGYKDVLKTISYVVPVRFEEGNGNDINVSRE